jgi:hypothetical protein
MNIMKTLDFYSVMNIQDLDSGSPTGSQSHGYWQNRDDEVEMHFHDNPLTCTRKPRTPPAGRGKLKSYRQ